MEFEINLLEKRQGTFFGEAGKYRWFTVVSAIIAGIGLIAFIGFRFSLGKKNTAPVIPSEQEFRKVTLEKEKASHLSDLIRRMDQRKIIWSEKLSCLSLSIPDQVFLTSLEFKQETSQPGRSTTANARSALVLRGVVISGPEEDLARSLQKFIKELRANQSFMQGFQDPVLLAVNNNRKENGAQKEGLNFELQLPQAEAR